jgi:transcriptional regulator with XRE-family HTH domain
MVNVKKLNELMQSNRWNSRNLARAAGLPQATVWRTVCGETCPTLSTLRKISSVLKVPISDLLIEDEVEIKPAA